MVCFVYLWQCSVQKQESDRCEKESLLSDERLADKKKISDLEGTVKALQAFVQNMADEKKKVLIYSKMIFSIAVYLIRMLYHF